MVAQDDWNGSSRRRFLQTGAGLGVLVASGLDRPVFAQSSFDWKKFKGEHIEVSLVRNPRGEILERYQKEFEEMTGIAVGFELVPEQQHRQKQVIEFTSGKPSFDVTTTSWHVQKRLFGRAKWLEDLRPFLANAAMTSPDFDYKDFSAGAVLFGTQVDGRIDSFPLSLDYILLYWNKEMFAAKGLSYPQTYDEILQVAAKLTDPSQKRYGWVSRGLKNANTYVWSSLMLGWGEDAVKPNGELNTDGPAAIAASEFVTRLIRESGPPGISGFNWAECQSAFFQGTIGMWPDSSGFAAPLEDPSKSRVAGKVGYGVIPAGPKARAVGLTGDGIGIAAGSSKREPSYFYLQWATNKLNQARFLQAGAGAGGRNSIYSDAKVQADIKASKDWVAAIKESAGFGRPAFPNIIPVTEFRDIFGIALTNMISGADPSKELKAATEAFKPVLEKSEKI